MKKSIKIISVLMMAVMLIATPVFAGEVVVDDVLNSVEASKPGDTTEIMSTINSILGFLQWAAIIGGVLIITILGIKYMMGSLEEKADYKKSMIPLVVGVIVVMGATTIANILFKTFA